MKQKPHKKELYKYFSYSADTCSTIPECLVCKKRTKRNMFVLEEYADGEVFWSFCRDYRSLSSGSLHPLELFKLLIRREPRGS